MRDDNSPLATDAELVEFERWAKEDLRGNHTQQAGARGTLTLLAEVRLARRLVRGLYHHIPEVSGQEETQAELERYAAALGVIGPARSDVH